MELQQSTTFPSFIFISLIIFFFFTFLLWKLLSKPMIQNLPPGPYKLPIIGHLHHLLGSLPHHSLRDLANKHGPLIYLQLGQTSSVVVSSPNVAKQVMKTHDLVFSDRSHNMANLITSYGGRDIIMAPYGELWRQLRKVCVLELLSAKRVQSFCGVREEEVLNLVQKISSVVGSSINLSEKFFELSNDITSRACFGKTFEDKDVFISLTKELIIPTAGFAIPDLFPSLKFLGTVTGLKPKLERMHRKIDKMLDEIIKEHVANRMSFHQGVKEDLVDVLLRLQKDEELGFPITTESVKAVIFDMFAAGTDTSATLMEWTFSELVRNPRVMNKVQDEVRGMFNGKESIQEADVNQLSYLGLVIKETLRLHPPAPLLVPRESRQRCEIDGYEIPKGTKVIVNAWAIGRDPENWTDPEKFEPERFQDRSIDYKGNNFEYIPFGGGRRICPGMTFGMASVELPLAMLLYHFDWQIANDAKPEELDMTEDSSIVVKRKNELYVIPTPYTPIL